MKKICSEKLFLIFPLFVFFVCFSLCQPPFCSFFALIFYSFYQISISISHPLSLGRNKGVRLILCCHCPEIWISMTSLRKTVDINKYILHFYFFVFLLKRKSRAIKTREKADRRTVLVSMVAKYSQGRQRVKRSQLKWNQEKSDGKKIQGFQVQGRETTLFQAPQDPYLTFLSPTTRKRLSRLYFLIPWKTSCRSSIVPCFSSLPPWVWLNFSFFPHSKIISMKFNSGSSSTHFGHMSFQPLTSCLRIWKLWKKRRRRKIAAGK